MARLRLVVLGWIVAAVAACLVFAGGAAAATIRDTIFGSATPATIDSGDGHSVELGLKFRSEVAGVVTGIRFYKAATNTGTHVGSLWTASGTLLAFATFTNETGTGWQQVNFSSPLAISANATYVAGYFASKGHYSDTSSAFATAGVSNPPLQALANSVSANGVYAYATSSTFPASTYKATNYWVDVSFEPTVPTVPGQVTNVTATSVSAGATVSWTAPPNGGSQITSYTITPYVGAEAQPTTTISGTPPASQATIKGLANGTTYTFKVTATNGVGPSPESQGSNAVTPASTPGAPTSLLATGGNGSATVSWIAPPDGGSQITSYTITPYVGTEAKPPTTITGAPPITSATIEGLTNGAMYTFKVTATNGVGPGPQSEASNAVTPVFTPGAPTSVLATGGNGTATVSWTAPANGGDQITSYTITPYVGTEAQPATTITGTPPVTNATVEGLANGASYTFKVTAINALGAGPTSEASNTVTPAAGATVPGMPTTVSAVGGNATATVSWSAPADGGSQIVSYTITPSIGSETQPATTITGSPPLTTSTITGLTNGTPYTFRVTATNAVGAGPASEASSAVTPATTPSTPGSVAATAGNGSATVTWNAPANGGSQITAYTITPYVGAEAKPTTAVTGTPPATSTNVTGLVNGTSYTFEVTATNSVGTGATSEPSNAVTPSGVTLAYPDLQVLMPTSDMYMVQNGAARTLEFTHISSDLGAGPLEIRPTYNSVTGISQGYQALYTMTSPGVWKFDHTVPIVGPMIWAPPSDYNFPLDKFWLYNTAAGGGPGSIVAASPKVEYCMTSDTYVGGVPNTPRENEYSSGECGLPKGRLGLTVGWGDKYDATDGGEGIDISSLPDGTYWLRGEIDPYHYFQESNTANNITDTKLKIEGDAVTVLEQTHPNSTPPMVTLSQPAIEAKLSGTATLKASASGPAPISSVQFLLDGHPIGSPVTNAPYTLSWPIGSTPTGSHYLSAQATDSNGFVGTAPDLPVTIEAGSGGEGPDTQPPTISITNPPAGEKVSNTIQVAANATDNVGVASVQFYLDGRPLGGPVTAPPYATSWDTTTASNGSHTLTAVATDTSGNKGTSESVGVSVQNPAESGPCFVMDARVVANGKGTVTTSAFTTAEAGEQLLAFVGSDGPAKTGGQSVTVSGGGLVWTRVTQAHARYGDAEIWTATALAPLSGVTVTSTPSAKGYDESLTVISMEMSAGVGASAVASASQGEPSVSLKTTEEGSLVFAVGNDYTAATPRTLGPNQVLLSQVLDTTTGDAYWSQYTGQITGAGGSTITMNDTTPTGDMWNMAAVELRGDGPGL